MLKNDYLERMRPYQNDFSDRLNRAYTLLAYPPPLRDIALFGRNVVHAGNVRRNASELLIDL